MTANVDDLVSEMTHLGIERALRHAAVVSLTCKAERTLGPDRPTWTEQLLSQKKSKDLPPPVSAPKTKPKSEPAPKLAVVRPLTPTPDDFPDINTLNNSIVKRELAEQCKQSVRNALTALQQQRQQLSSEKERSAMELNTEIQEERSKRLALKKQMDLRIEQQAEQLANAQLEADKREQEALHKQTNQLLHDLSFEGVARYQLKFRMKYEGIAKVLMALDKETQKACGAHNRQLSSLVQMFDNLIGQIKAGNCGPQELMSAEQFCHSLDEVEDKFHKQLKELSQQLAHRQHQLKVDEANKAKQLAEEKQRAEHEEQVKKEQEFEAQKQKEQQQQQQQQQQHQQQQQQQQQEASMAAAAPEAPPTGMTTTTIDGNNTAASAVPSISTTYVHPTRLAFSTDINNFYQIKVESVKPLQTDEAWKKYRTNCQRAINVPLNAITAVSAQHLTLNFEKLLNFFAGQPVKTTDGSSITINDHPLARDYCVLLMAKKFVSQSETAISSNPQAAFPFASVIVTFWKLLPDFGKIFLAYIYKESPYLIPYIMPQLQGQTPEQYLKSIGYRLSDKNEIEKPDMYLKRQTGLARLYAAVIITPGRKVDGPAHPFGIEEAWRWLTHILQVKPLPDICATMIVEMLQTLGFELWRTYGRQFLKLLLYIQQQYIPLLTAYVEGGPKTRLEMLLAKFLREGQIPQAVGILPPGFW